jgi:hypothetical protein
VNPPGGLPAVLQLREREAERRIGQRIAVVVDVEPIDRIGMEPVTLHERVGVQDQHGPVGVIRRGEDEKLGQVQAGVVAGCLRLAALKRLDMITPSLVLLWVVELRQVELGLESADRVHR